MTDTAVPQMPGFLQAILTGLAPHQAEAVYRWAVSNPDAGNQIVDATQPQGNDVYGEGV